MRLRRKLSITIVLQIIGTTANVLANIIIARRYGPNGQGYLSRYRSMALLFSSIGLMGFPQAFVYLINNKKLDSALAVKFSTYYGACLGGIAIIGLGGLHVAGLVEFNGFDTITIGAALISSMCMVIHGMYRAISLSTKTVPVFNVISIMPSIFSLLMYVFWKTHNYKILIIVIPVASSVSVGIAMYFLREFFGKPGVLMNNFNKIKQFSTYGLWSFIPEVMPHFVLTTTYSILKKIGGSEDLAGYFSISYLFLSMSILPLNMIIPVLFDSWAKESDRRKVLNSYVKLAHAGTIGSSLVYGLSITLNKPIIAFFLGQRFFPSVQSTNILLLSMYAIYQSRLLTAILLSIGMPSVVAIGAIIRTITIILLMNSVVFNENTLANTALFWVIGNFFSMLYMVIMAHKHTKGNLWQMSGLSFGCLGSTTK